MKRLAAVIASAFASSVIVLLCAALWDRATLSIEIENASGSPVTGVKVEFEGGSVKTPKLDNSMTLRRRINVRSESGLTLSFSDTKGVAHQTNLNVYLEPRYRGTIRVKIDANQQVPVTNLVRVS